MIVIFQNFLYKVLWYLHIKKIKHEKTNKKTKQQAQSRTRAGKVAGISYTPRGSVDSEQSHTHAGDPYLARRSRASDLARTPPAPDREFGLAHFSVYSRPVL